MSAMLSVSVNKVEHDYATHESGKIKIIRIRVNKVNKSGTLGTVNIFLS